MGEPGTEPWLIRHRIVVRFSDCDPLGHVNNARYSTYLEETRIVLWRRQAGIELRRAAQTGGPAGQKREGFILARAEIDFRSQAHDGDELEIRLALEGFGRTSATYRYEIVMAGTRRVVASARTVQVWYDYDAGKPVPLTERTRELLATSVSDRK